MATEQRERELTFDVPDGWQLADPSDLLPPGGGVEREVVHLESAYYDTVEHGLLRAGLTLRRRTGDTDNGWHLKIPAGDARTEIRLPVSGRSVPAELREITLGARAGAALRPVATLSTERAIARLRTADGAALLEIAVDAVTAAVTHGDDRPGGEVAELQRWREVEIELLDGDEKLLQRAATWLRRSGARPAPTGSKLARTFEGTAVPRPERPGRLGGLVAAYLDEQWDAVVRGDVALRRGEEVIHKTRVGTRRYRSVLRVFADVVDAERAAHLDGELRWYARALGEVRDRQVMRKHLDEQLAALPPELVLGPVADRIHATLDAELSDARQQLARVMRSKRYFALLRELRDWHESPPLVRNPRADRVERYLAASRRRVRTRLERARTLPAGADRDEAMHRVRKAAKRARYTAELAQPRLGEAAAKVVARMTTLQDELGDQQDGVVTAALLRRLGAVAGTVRGENGFTFGVLFERERQRTESADRDASGDR